MKNSSLAEKNIFLFPSSSFLASVYVRSTPNIFQKYFVDIQMNIRNLNPKNAFSPFLNAFVEKRVALEIRVSIPPSQSWRDQKHDKELLIVGTAHRSIKFVKRAFFAILLASSNLFYIFAIDLPIIVFVCVCMCVLEKNNLLKN